MDIDNLGGLTRDPILAWRYNLGIALGEPSGKITQWYLILDSHKFDKSISESLTSVKEIIKTAPSGTSPKLLASLQSLAKWGEKSTFSMSERLKIGEALNATLKNTVSFLGVE